MAAAPAWGAAPPYALPAARGDEDDDEAGPLIAAFGGGALSAPSAAAAPPVALAGLDPRLATVKEVALWLAAPPPLPGRRAPRLAGDPALRVLKVLYEGRYSTVALVAAGGGAGAGGALAGPPTALAARKAYDKEAMGERHMRSVAREVAISRALAAERVPGVVPLLDVAQDARHVWLFSRACLGGDLFARARAAPRGRLPPAAVAAGVAAPIARALAALHARGIVHRDVKPENIFLDADGAALLGDFGLAIDATAEAPTSRVGTTDFMAPEQLARRPGRLAGRHSGMGLPPSAAAYGAPVDVWALGCTVYELLTGGAPFGRAPSSGGGGKGKGGRFGFSSSSEDEGDGGGGGGGGDAAREAAILAARPPPFPAGVPPLARDFVLACLRRDPGARPTAAALLAHPWIAAAGPGAGAAGAPAAAAPAPAAAPPGAALGSPPKSPGKGAAPRPADGDWSLAAAHAGGGGAAAADDCMMMAWSPPERLGGADAAADGAQDVRPLLPGVSGAEAREPLQPQQRGWSRLWQR